MKLSKLLLTLFFSHTIIIANGQDTTKIQRPQIVSVNKINIFVPSIGLEREQKMSKFSTLSIGVNYQYTFLREYSPYINYSPSSNGYQIQDQGVNVNTKVKAVPGASINYRYYYNVDKRASQQKSILKNSANYMGVDLGAIFPRMFNENNQYDYQLMITPNWGIQRNQNKNGNFEFAIGPSLVINPYEVLLGVGFKLGASIIF